MALLSVHDMTHWFGGLQAVSGYNVAVEPGQIRGLIGPNGAGKTTLMRMIMHSIPLDTGTITLDRPDAEDVVVSTLPASRLAGLGVVKSNQVIMDFDKLTIWDSLLLSVAEAQYEQPWRMRSERTVFEETDLNETVREVLQLFAPQVRGRDIRLKERLDPDLRWRAA